MGCWSVALVFTGGSVCANALPSSSSFPFAPAACPVSERCNAEDGRGVTASSFFFTAGRRMIGVAGVPGSAVLSLTTEPALLSGVSIRASASLFSGLFFPAGERGEAGERLGAGGATEEIVLSGGSFLKGLKMSSPITPATSAAAAILQGKNTIRRSLSFLYRISLFSNTTAGSGTLTVRCNDANSASSDGPRRTNSSTDFRASSSSSPSIYDRKYSS